MLLDHRVPFKLLRSVGEGPWNGIVSDIQVEDEQVIDHLVNFEQLRQWLIWNWIFLGLQIADF